MTDLEQALAISGGIFAAVMASQYGNRDVSWHKFVFPVLSLAGFAWFYLKDAPTAGVDWAVYAVGALIGLAFGIGASVTTRVRRDAAGHARTVCGPAFALVWASAVALRIAFILLAEHDAAFRAQLGRFMFSHQIVEAAIAPFFLIMAATTVLSRLVIIGARARARVRALRPAAIATPAAALAEVPAAA